MWNGQAPAGVNENDSQAALPPALRDAANDSPQAAAPVAAATEAAQHTIDQVRELLFGHEKRRTDQTFVDLRSEMSRQIEALRAEMRQHVDTLTNCLIDLEHTSEKRRLASISDIGKAIADLGASIQTMGAHKTDE